MKHLLQLISTKKIFCDLQTKNMQITIQAVVSERSLKEFKGHTSTIDTHHGVGTSKVLMTLPEGDKELVVVSSQLLILFIHETNNSVPNKTFNIPKFNLLIWVCSFVVLFSFVVFFNVTFSFEIKGAAILVNILAFEHLPGTYGGIDEKVP